ncbi:MAG TPA: hypothetical protein VF480_09635, partial [Verrucomicrobiae bacterium]
MVYFTDASPSGVRRRAKVVACSAASGMSNRFIGTLLAKTRTGVEEKTCRHRLQLMADCREIELGAVSEILWPPRQFRANELRASVV